MKSKRPVLVVDDNEINQMVAAEELELEGYLSELAGNGLEALQMVKERRFRLVLMDCQMPLMDGFTATMEIRKWERSQGQDRYVPIVALTGHDDDSEKKKAFASGMDDFLFKPFTGEDVRRIMVAFPEGGVPPSVVGVRPMDPAGEIDLTPGVRRSKRLMELFLEHVPQQLELLRAAQAAGVPDAVRSHAHKLKGSCLALAAEPMAAAAEKLQHQSDAGDLTQADALVTELEGRFLVVAGLLQQELDSL